MWAARTGIPILPSHQLSQRIPAVTRQPCQGQKPLGRCIAACEGKLSYFYLRWQLLIRDLEFTEGNAHILNCCTHCSNVISLYLKDPVNGCGVEAVVIIQKALKFPARPIVSGNGGAQLQWGVLLSGCGAVETPPVRLGSAYIVT